MDHELGGLVLAPGGFTQAADPTFATRLAATGQVVDVRGPAEFAAGIKEVRDRLASIAQALGLKAAQ